MKKENRWTFEEQKERKKEKKTMVKKKTTEKCKQGKGRMDWKK